MFSNGVGMGPHYPRTEWNSTLLLFPQVRLPHPQRIRPARFRRRYILPVNVLFIALVAVETFRCDHAPQAASFLTVVLALLCHEMC